MGISLDSINASLHSIKISDGTNDLAIDGSGYITSNVNGTVTIADGGGSITVDGTVAATQSGTWDIGTLTSITNDVNIADGGNSITVDSTDLATIAGAVSGTEMQVDVLTQPARSHTTDSIKIGDGTDFLAIETDGSINVNGNFVLDSFDTWKSTNQSISSTASQIAATPLTGRKSMIIQNLGSADFYIGVSNAVTSSTGTLVPKGASIEKDWSAVATVWAITSSGTSDARIAEFSA